MSGKDRIISGSTGIYGTRRYVNSPEWYEAMGGPQTPVEDPPKPLTTGNPYINPETGLPYPPS